MKKAELEAKVAELEARIEELKEKEQVKKAVKKMLKQEKYDPYCTLRQMLRDSQKAE